MMRATNQLPLLRHGDRMTRQEFERRWALSPTVKLAELIDGIAHVPGPRPHTTHGAPAFDLIAVLGMYSRLTPHVQGGAHPSLRLDDHNEPQPAVVLLVDRFAVGTAPIDAEGFITGPPELLADVVPGDDVDLVARRADLYCRAGVGEYLVWRTTARRFEHFALVDGRYRPVEPADDGLLRSARFPGLWVNTAALVAGDLPTVLTDIRCGLASPEHAAFVAELLRRAAANV